MSDLAEQINALLALNAKGAVSHPVPGLAVELLERASSSYASSQAEIARLREALRGLVKAVEADASVEGFDPRNTLEAHTFVAVAMAEADAALSESRSDG